MGVASWDADDLRLVSNTFVTMFWRTSLFDDTVDRLRSRRYDVVEFDAGS